MLCRILAKHGKEICTDARRCEGLLNDLCGSYRREINVLVNALEERIPLDLMAANSSMPLELLLTRLEKRLEDQLGLTAEAARWAVESWALALNVVTEIEIQQRLRKRVNSGEQISETEKIQPKDSNSGKTSNLNRSAPPAAPPLPPPPNAQRTIPGPQAKPPPARNQPGKMPVPAPPVLIPANNQPVNQPQIQTPNPAPPRKRSFGIIRGCLIMFFLLIISTVLLFFGAPYAIKVMRETQQERDSESPRFPSR